jgi:hypothetical protein
LGEDGQRLALSGESLPLRGEDLKNEVSGDKSKHQEFHVVEGFCYWGLWDDMVTAKETASFGGSLKGADPNLESLRGQRKRTLKSFPRGGTKKRIAVKVGMVPNRRTLEGKNGK